MKTLIYLFVVVVVFLPLPSAICRGQETIEGTYVVFSKDQKIETDKIKVVPGEEYNDDIRSAGADAQHQVAKLVYQGGTLVSYERTSNDSSITKATADDKFLKLLDREQLVGMFAIDEKIYLLDPNMYSQYAFLLRVFDELKKDKARLNVCVPQVGDFMYVDVERHGTDEIKVGDNTITLNHYKFYIGKKETVNCWVVDGKIIGIYMAIKGVYATDASYDKLYESLKKIINRAM